MLWYFWSSIKTETKFYLVNFPSFSVVIVRHSIRFSILFSTFCRIHGEPLPWHWHCAARNNSHSHNDIWWGSFGDLCVPMSVCVFVFVFVLSQQILSHLRFALWVCLFRIRNWFTCFTDFEWTDDLPIDKIRWRWYRNDEEVTPKERSTRRKQSQFSTAEMIYISSAIKAQFDNKKKVCKIHDFKSPRHHRMITIRNGWRTTTKIRKTEWVRSRFDNVQWL